MRYFAREVRLRAAVGVLGCALLLSGCGSLITGDPESTGRKNWAILVGVGSYRSPALDLKWADEDALDVYDALRRGKNWETDKITLLTNGSATKDAIKAAIGGLAKHVGADDQVLFYFSGRGSFAPDQPPFDEGDGLDEYLLPFDAQPESPARDVSDDELEALFSALPTNNVLIVLDTGFSCGNGSGKEKCFERAGARVKRPRGIDGMAHDLARPGFIYLSSAQAGEAGSESGQLRNSVFTYYLVEGLRGAANPGRNLVSAQQAFEYAAPRTTSYASGQVPLLVDNRGKGFRVTAY
ncbi:MAG TPA: caspase family protein [Candidatus Methanoperedens sp.]|nr:caspase family protein [Candidatus Methanoperedens sp.]